MLLGFLTGRGNWRSVLPVTLLTTRSLAGSPFSIRTTRSLPMGCAVWISVFGGASKFHTTFLPASISVTPNWWAKSTFPFDIRTAS